MSGPQPRDPRHRFDELYIPEPNSGCWLWIGATGPGGYGNFAVLNGIFTTSHRFALQIATGEEGIGLEACHHCDVRPCVNPDHLFWGTRSENCQDVVRKGRNPYSNRTHCPKGHPYDEINTYRQGRKRYCRECARIRLRRRSL